MKYSIIRTDKFNEQLYEIINYIAGDADMIDAALRYLDKIEKAVKLLEDFPLSGSIPRYRILKKQGYRVLIIEKHILFYKVSEESMLVTLYAMVDGRREYLNLI
ncbi:type II toxin-antitoxin system RelE/ParE family toxin [Acetobacterium wieringae]|uniref:Type II toxin-antitoxin system RelE/ParE family toxin n=1 Tax=Acetobacterium wieringae TaxID=52694 RepID=A0ABY6HI29_9FIRM|nr:type II toxin-antitoxin system RelE/ParE family toxin [Acetobacterium wieringae]MEA4807259.1 type II toxin-antitoxin system RelE/ParE family toxin [Acetobacterium wieringae]UYO63945.1 type II toxin-antitoxin system RelE/ParE family toxin [Acetobacterium wieringae]